MRIREITESLDTSNFEVVEDNDSEYISKFVVNSNKYLFHAENMDEEADIWEISFASVTGDDWVGLTGTGGASKVLSNVVHSWSDFVSKHNPATMTLSAEGQTRKSIYSRMIKKYLPNWLVTVSGDEFTLHRR